MWLATNNEPCEVHRAKQVCTNSKARNPNQFHMQPPISLTPAHTQACRRPVAPRHLQPQQNFPVRDWEPALEPGHFSEELEGELAVEEAEPRGCREGQKLTCARRSRVPFTPEARGAARRGPPWRCRCPLCWSAAIPGAETPVSAAGRGGRCPRCCSRQGRGRGGVASFSPRRRWGRAPRESRGFASWRKSLRRGWQVSYAVLPVFPPPFPTPFFSCRCGFAGFFSSTPPPLSELGECPCAFPRAAPEQTRRARLAREGRAACRLPSGAGGSVEGSPPHTPHVCLIRLCRPSSGRG